MAKLANWTSIAAVVLLGSAAGTASAGFIYVDRGGTQQTVSASAGSAAYNDFNGRLAGIDGDAASSMVFDLGRVLGLDGADRGTVSATFFGSEAGYNNLFQFAGGAGRIDTGFAPYNLRNVWGAAGPSISTAAGAGALGFHFCAWHAGAAVTGPGVSADGCVSNAENDLLGLNSFQSIGSYIAPTGNAAWLLWDDSGANGDDDHDDMVIRLDYTPVPEPGTLLLTGIGLLALGAMRRQRRGVASASA